MNRPKERRILTIGLVGNPNCGKTTLFNGLTGSRLKTANWPGVTVEEASGWIAFEGIKIHVIDLPGIYSLDCCSAEERASCRWLQKGGVDVIINVADSSVLDRSLALTLQLIQLGTPVVLAVNLFGRKVLKGTSQASGWNLERLQSCLGGVPCLLISARKSAGLYELLKTAVTEVQRHPFGLEGSTNPAFWYRSAEKRYQYIEEIHSKCCEKTEHVSGCTDRADRWLMHPIWGIPIFLFLMAFVFFLTFSVGNIPKQGMGWLLEYCLDIAENFFEQTGTEKWLKSLIMEGIIPGVGSVLSFLPNMLILFFALSVLEDSGYMARAAYVMNETMGMAGLSGKSFLPLMLGFGCTVPAVMAARIVEGENQKKRTILAAHFMSCPARMTIYVLFSQMFFPEHAVLAACSIYLTGIVAAVLTAAVHWRISGESREDCLFLELPEYRMPSLKHVVFCVWDKAEEYLAKAGTTILLSSVLLWFCLHMGPSGPVSDISCSFAASAGRLLAPIFSVAGLGSWQTVSALLLGLSAKEAVVSGFSVLYGIQNVNSAAGTAQLQAELSACGFGPVNAYALMIFCLFYTPCFAAMSAVRVETGDVKWTVRMGGFQLASAFLSATAVYHIGCLLFPG